MVFVLSFIVGYECHSTAVIKIPLMAIKILYHFGFVTISLITGIVFSLPLFIKVYLYLNLNS
jgi:hypothetical protein